MHVRQLEFVRRPAPVIIPLIRLIPAPVAEQDPRRSLPEDDAEREVSDQADQEHGEEGTHETSG
jgi:hypothetical protein